MVDNMTGYQSKRAASNDKLTGTRHMKVQEIIDYAYPNMMAEKHLRAAHQAMLWKQYDAALDHTAEAIAYADTMMDAIRAMRKQAGH
jgi:hypothetical protein